MPATTDEEMTKTRQAAPPPALATALTVLLALATLLLAGNAIFQQIVNYAYCGGSGGVWKLLVDWFGRPWDSGQRPVGVKRLGPATAPRRVGELDTGYQMVAIVLDPFDLKSGRG